MGYLEREQDLISENVSGDNGVGAHSCIVAARATAEMRSAGWTCRSWNCQVEEAPGRDLRVL